MAYYSTVNYLCGAWQSAQFPADSGVEAAFAGRSNSGKSSAINAITGRTALARTSKTPGRTQLINFFSMEESQRLVDLPGYGFAKVPPAMQQHWHQLMGSYFEQRQSLHGLIILMDSRHPLKDSDGLMIEWGNERGIHVHVLLSKADKLSQSEGAQNIARRQNRARRSSDGAIIFCDFTSWCGRGTQDSR